MSIQSEINRISGNVSSALAAIAEKGVSVPSGSKSDALAELIASIEAGGGGLPEGVSAMAYGTVVPAADGNTISLAHNLGVRPDFFVWWLDDAHSVESGGALRGSLTHSTVDAETFNVGYISVGYITGGTFDLTSGSVQGTYYMNATRVTCFCSSNTPLKAGYTYHWIAGVLNNKA